MKKRLLTCVIAMLSVMAFAQNHLTEYMSPLAGMVKNLGSVNKNSVSQESQSMPQTHAPHKAGTVVVPPAGLKCDEYVLFAIDIDDKKASGVLSLGFDGNDVYVSGVCKELPNAWIKGTRNGDKITFASGQYLGKVGGILEMYFAGYDSNSNKLSDVVFDYDVAANTITSKQVVMINDNDKNPSFYYAYTYTSLLKVAERAGTPATPQIDKVFLSKIGAAPRLMFTIPLVDTNGNAMKSSKITYKIYSDIHHTMAPVTFHKSEYVKLEEDITEIPYDYTDNKNIYTGDIDLLMDYTKWNRIGVKVTYNGGGESHDSAIGWFSLADADTLPAGVKSVEYILNVEDANYDNDPETRIIKVAIDGDNVYMSGLASRFPEGWIKGKKTGDKIVFPADKYMGEFIVPGSKEVQHYYFNPVADVEFLFNEEEQHYTADAYTIDYADETSETGLSNFDNYEDVEVLPIEDMAAVPEQPEMNSFEKNWRGDYFVTFDVYAKNKEGEYIMPSKLSYQLFFDKGDGVATPYVFTSSFYGLKSDMTTIPYNLTTDNGTISNEGDYHTVILNTRDVASWTRFGVKSIYNGGGETYETTTRWIDVNKSLGIDEVGVTVANTVLYDMQGRRVNDNTKGLLIKKMNMTDGSVKTMRIMK